MEGPRPPLPDGARTLDELTVGLDSLRRQAGLSFRELHRRVVRLRKALGKAEVPSQPTVYRCFQPGRTRIDNELLTDLVRTMLGDDAEAARWRHAYQRIVGERTDAASITVADALPEDSVRIIGRGRHLDAVLRVGDLDGPGHHRVVSIEGMAGVGKTTLAVHAAHELLRSGHGRDVVFYVDLRGYDPFRAPADPAAVLDGLLRRLGVPGAEIPARSLNERAAACNRRLEGKRALILLDNAANEDQVRSLIPEGAGCVTLVTSRRRLDRLPALHVPLDVLTIHEALDMLGHSVGPERIDADGETAQQIVELVGRLPLALSLVGARMTAHPGWTLADHRDRLRERRDRLSLDDGLELSLAASLEALPSGQRQFFQLLALHPGQDFDVYAAAALGNVPRSESKVMLEALSTAHLLESRTRGRYQFHDLVRTFTAGRAHEDLPPSGRKAALRRLLDYYRQVALDAASLLPTRRLERWPRLRKDFAQPALDTTTAAAWLETELSNLVMAVECGSEQSPQHACDLAFILAPFLDLSAHYREAEVVHGHATRLTDGPEKGWALNELGLVKLSLGRHDTALDLQSRAIAIAERAGDRSGTARALSERGVVLKELGRYDEALGHYERALEIAEQDSDESVKASALNNIGVLCSKLGRYDDAIAYYERALVSSRRSNGGETGCRTLMNLGNCYTTVGRYADALRYYEMALDIARERPDRTGEGRTLENLGCLYLAMGDPAKAFECHSAAARISQEVGDRVCLDEALNHLGVCCAKLGRRDAAMSHHRKALHIARDIGHREGEVTALIEIGNGERSSGHCEQALACLREALSIAEDLGHPLLEARTRVGIARALSDGGEVGLARQHWERAEAIYLDLGISEGEEAANELGEVAQSRSGR